MPLTAADVEDVFGGEVAVRALDDLAAEGLVRRRRGGWFWALPTERPHAGVDIRGSGGEQVVVRSDDVGDFTHNLTERAGAMGPALAISKEGNLTTFDLIDTTEPIPRDRCCGDAVHDNNVSVLKR